MTVQGIPCVAVLTLRGLLVVRLDPAHLGETLARFPWETHFANSIAAPAVDGDSVILTSGYSQSRTARVRMTASGAELVWEAKGVFSKVCTPIVADGRVYFAWHKLRCLDWETGAQLWAGGRFGDDASMILTADRRLVVFGGGSLALCATDAASSDGFEQLAIREDVVPARGWPHVALSAGRILCRDRDGRLVCLNLHK
jgi:outer membrane protein assembly factor BamB